MCGIVGYIGKNNAQDTLLSGLARLEYRGYDSAGVVTFDGKPTLLREKGKIADLNKLVKKNKTRDHIGIGHTRWATHGEPSVRNAHPHRAGQLFMVHNGIIENYKELKTHLKNHKFFSETDSEVLVALINSFYKDNLTEAVIKALQLVTGTYGIAVVAADHPDQIVVARNGSPLIIGVGLGENLIASDASALLGYTNRAIYLNDGEVATLTRDGIDIKNLANEPVAREVEKIEADLAQIQKQGYAHFLLKEICEQPKTLAETLRGRVNVKDGTVKLGGINMTAQQLREVKHLTIVGCGTAYYAGLLASYYIEQLVEDITVNVVIASEFRYKSSYIPENSVALIVSQSGETADTLACMREIQNRGIKCLGIINSVGSTIARESDGGVYIHAGPEISVASTKAFTSQTSAMLMFGIMLAQSRSLNPRDVKPYVTELAALPGEIEKLLKNHSLALTKLAKKYAKYEHAIYLGRGTAYPVALEGALKLKEISYIDANGYPAGELKHGPIALVDNRFFEFFVIPDDDLLDKSISNLEEVRARNGHTIAVTNSSKKFSAEVTVKVNTKLKVLAPILLNIVQQLFAYHVAVARGNDVDQPRNLAKSVTVE
jgi:glucosamine--fructose-6-phosphate aminotransferase (isomerizing)